MTPSRSRRVCFVCRRGGNQRDPLGDTLSRDVATGQWRNDVVHLNAGCLKAFVVDAEARGIQLDPAFEQYALLFDPTTDPKGEPTMPKDTVTAPPAETPATEVANEELRPDPPAAAPPAVPSRAAAGALTTQQVVDFITRGVALPELSSEDAGLEIARRLLTAENPEELLEEQEFAHAEAVQYRPLIIHGVGWRPGKYEESGLPFYAVIDLTDATTGERQLVSCGGQNVVAQLIRADQRGWFPLQVQLLPTNKPTDAGYFPLWLRPWTTAQKEAAGKGQQPF